LSADFGFDVQNVFGTARKGRKKGKSKRKKDSMDMMMKESFGGMGLGIDTFSLATPNIDALSLGSDFGDVVGSRAGQANGKRGGFLDIIGSAQFGIPAITGKGRIARGKGKGRKTRARTPLQRSSGSRFGEVDREFAGNVIGNIRGAKRRISEFRTKRRLSKTKSTRDPPQLEFKERPTAVRDSFRPTPALPPPRETGTLPRDRIGSSAIQRFREESERRSAT